MRRLISSFLKQFSLKMKTNKFVLQNGLDCTIRNVIPGYCLAKLLFCLVDVKMHYALLENRNHYSAAIIIPLIDNSLSWFYKSFTKSFPDLQCLHNKT